MLSFVTIHSLYTLSMTPSIKRTTTSTLLLVLFAAFAAQLSAQTVLQRYIDPVYNESDISVQKNITYVEGEGDSTINQGTYPADYDSIFAPYALKMDVYSPPSDDVTERPVLILACGGSFLTPNATAEGDPPLGTKEDYPIVELCTRFAQRGYVTISMDYRRGWNPLGSGEVPQRTIVRAAYRAVQDGRALVRYLKKHVAEDGNTWGIDTSRIAFGGSQAGGYIPIHMYLLNTYDAIFDEPKIQDVNNEPYIDTTFQGPIEGLYGSLGYSDEFQLIISMGAAALDTSFLLPGMPPILGVHGTEDLVTPYGTDIVIAGGLVEVVEVSGSGDLIAYSNSIGNQDPLLPDYANDEEPGLLPFVGAGFQPYAYYDSYLDGDDPDNLPDKPQEYASALAYLDSTITFLAPRMFKVLDLPLVTERSEDILLSKDQFRMFPNPTTAGVNIELRHTSALLESAEVMDISGKQVHCANLPAQPSAALDIAHLPAGVYMIRVTTTEGVALQKLMKQ